MPGFPNPRRRRRAAGCGRLASLAVALLAGLPGPARAQTTLASYADGLLPGVFVPGVRVPVLAAGEYDQLAFNLYSYVQPNPPPGNPPPYAFGTLYLLDREYLGAPLALGESTPGFLARSQQVLGGRWLFDPSVTIVGGRTYFFLVASDRVETTLGSPSANLPGGGLYLAPTGTEPFTFQPAGSPSYLLTGRAASVVPEPATWASVGTGLVLVGLAARRRRATHPTATSAGASSSAADGSGTARTNVKEPPVSDVASVRTA